MNIDPPIPGVRIALFVAVLVAFCLALLGATVGGDLGRLAGVGALIVIVAIPLARVAGLGIHWWRIRDRRYSAAAAGLLAVVGIGAIIAAL